MLVVFVQPGASIRLAFPVQNLRSRPALSVSLVPASHPDGTASDLGWPTAGCQSTNALKATRAREARHSRELGMRRVFRVTHRSSNGRPDQRHRDL